MSLFFLTVSINQATESMMYETLNSTMRVLKDIAYSDCGNLKKFYDYKVSNMKEQDEDAHDMRE